MRLPGDGSLRKWSAILSYFSWNVMIEFYFDWDLCFIFCGSVH